MGMFAKSCIAEGCVNQPTYGLRSPRNEAYLRYAAVTRATLNADIHPP